jgi:hypothetical protein
MTEKERLLLTELIQLFQDRDDFVVGVTAALLDLYREEFAAGRQTLNDAITRLSAQRDALRDNLGEKYLTSLIQTLEDGQLNAAALARAPAQGSA